MTTEPLPQTKKFMVEGAGPRDNAGMMHTVSRISCICGNQCVIMAVDSQDAAAYFETHGWTYRKTDQRARCSECSIKEGG